MNRKSDLRSWLWYAVGDAVGKPLHDFNITDKIYQGAMFRSADSQRTSNGPWHKADQPLNNGD